LQVIGIIIGILALYLLIVTFAPGLKVPEQPLQKAKQLTKKVSTKPPQSRKDVTFQVKGTSISAWLYLPEDLSVPVPCIIMGHGFGGTKDMIMEYYALRYQKAGFAVLAFDYRHFGESEGEPRQLMLIPYQLEDYTAAIDYARNLKEIDPARIALWGTSASGGYGMVIAAKDKNIACVCAQCPGLDPHASREMFLKSLGIGHFLRLFVHGQRDMMRFRLGLSPHKIPIVGKPGSIAFLPISDAYDGYSKLAPENFINKICARVILRSHGFKPVEHLRKVQCPVLIQICDHDSLAPISAETAKELEKYAEVKHYPIGHFDIYIGDDFEKNVSDQLEFFKKHL
ncbi:MAG: alpha/beta fold hydrolase, partial [Candidatus Caldatribacteriota bacterium]|nr:alpha/beta fold hydrolase [Candidatus Caldatribacteriota bacterium]